MANNKLMNRCNFQWDVNIKKTTLRLKLSLTFLVYSLDWSRRREVNVDKTEIFQRWLITMTLTTHSLLISLPLREILSRDNELLVIFSSLCKQLLWVVIITTFIKCFHALLIIPPRPNYRDLAWGELSSSERTMENSRSGSKGILLCTSRRLDLLLGNS